MTADVRKQEAQHASDRASRLTVSRRTFLRSALLAAGGSVLAACGATSAPAVQPSAPAAVSNAPITITLWTHVGADERNWFASEFPSSATAVLPNSNITLNMVSMPHGDLHTKALANMSTGQDVPDIIGITHDFWARFLKGSIVEDNLAPIDDLVADVNDDYIGLEAWVKGGKHYGMRQDIATTVLWYREDLFQEAGITTPISTWDDLLAASKQLQPPAKFAIPAITDDVMFSYQHISQLHGTYWTNDGQWSFNSPETLEVIRYLKRGVDEQAFLPVSASDFWGSKFLASNEVVAAVMPSWYGTYVLFPAVPEQKGTWRVQLLPTWNSRGHTATSVWGGTAWVFNKQSPNVEATMQVAKHMFTSLEPRVRYTFLAKSLPAWRPALSDQRLLNATEPFLGEQKWNEVFNTALQDSVPAIQTQYDFDVQTVLNERLPRFMSGEIEAEAFLREVDAQIQALGIPVVSA